jgi:hypothetical protein
MQPLSFLRQIANFSPGRDMIFQNFGQGVSNLSTVAELRTFDGIIEDSYPKVSEKPKKGTYEIQK